MGWTSRKTSKPNSMRWPFLNENKNNNCILHFDNLISYLIKLDPVSIFNLIEKIQYNIIVQSKKPQTKRQRMN